MKAATAADVAEVFLRDVAEHQMIVLQDDGLYRHLRFKAPGTGLGHFDITTWPGHLALGGDREGYVFAWTRDMFEFFRAKSGWNHASINPQYWAQKLATRVPVKVYDEDKFRSCVIDDFVSAVRGGYGPKGLGRAVRDEILDNSDIEFEDGARMAVRDFRYRYTVDVFDAATQRMRPEARYWSFEGAWEWDLTDWDFHYLYACHAIQWGIDRYDDTAARSERLILALTS